MPPLPRLSRPHRDDVLIAAAGLLGGVLLWVLGLQGRPLIAAVPPWLSLVALAVATGAELLRRTAPLTGLALATAALTLDTCAGTLLATVVMFTDLVYAAVLHGGPRAARRIPPATALATVLGTLIALAVARAPEALFVGVFLGLLTLTPASTGLIVRHHRDAAQAARLRAEQTALLAEMDRAQAVTAERARMARELHDVVAGHLSAIALHTTAAQTLDDPAATREALGVIRENSVQGLAEMRRLIGLLRASGGAEADGEPAAVPTLDGLPALLARARAAGAGDGLAFRLDDARRENGDTARLPAPVELAAYRIVQESVTNALKHAAPGEVTVRLARPPDGPLTVVVTSPYGVRRGPGAARVPGSGAGLTGMRERAALLGGGCDAGPADGPGGPVWRVAATLPATEETPPP
ncbi:sensor histidine kinase [Streptomyces catenulae]|uniref:histidine kinase n=1 Tax=Streptomyces catenulae TaxID=66875 RepID=A0ABV2YV80_9ACTN|nr:histidine kinase [Streptomyces catenulae]